MIQLAKRVWNEPLVLMAVLAVIAGAPEIPAAIQVVAGTLAAILGAATRVTHRVAGPEETAELRKAA